MCCVMFMLPTVMYANFESHVSKCDSELMKTQRQLELAEKNSKDVDARTTRVCYDVARNALHKASVDCGSHDPTVQQCVSKTLH